MFKSLGSHAKMAGSGIAAAPRGLNDGPDVWPISNAAVLIQVLGLPKAGQSRSNASLIRFIIANYSRDSSVEI